MRDERIESWYRAYHGRLRAYGTRLLGDAAAAEDVAQETLLRAWSRREAFDPAADIGPWLFRVARNLCTDALRARARFADHDEPPDRPAADADPSEPLERAEMCAMVRTAFAGLSERQRELLVLREIEGVGYPELASRLGVSEECVRAIVFRARRGLRKRLAAVTRALAAIVFLPFVRMRDAARRAGGSPMWGQPVGVAIAQAGLGLAAAVAMIVAPPTTLHERVAGNQRAEIGAIGAVEPSDVAEAPTVSAGTAARPSPRAARPVAVMANRSGEVSVRATTQNPVTSDDMDVWANVWREAGEDPSIVLGTVDKINETACGHAAATCATVDGLLGNMEGR